MKSDINETITFWTDAATLAVFHPECLKHRLNANCDWWCGSLAEIEEVAEGRVTFISTAADGVFKVRITSGDLAPLERDYAKEKLGPLGLEVKSVGLELRFSTNRPHGRSGLLLDWCSILKFGRVLLV